MPTKAEIRNAALKRRDGVEPAARADFAVRLATIGPRVIGEFAPVTAPVVSLYSPIGSEPDSMPLAAVLHARGLRLALPVDWSSGTPLLYRRWVPGDRLAAGPLGIAEPLVTEAACIPDVVVTPLAAFDRQGQRVGYGAGNVDRTLESLRAQKAVLFLGVAYALQEEEMLPNDPHDQKLDVVITDREVVNCLADRSDVVAELPR